MYRFIQKFGKQIMAVFSVFLMIAFAYTGKNSGGATGRNPLIGQMNGQKVYNSELTNARASWELLKRLPWRESLTQAHRLGPDAYFQISKHPVMLLLLQKEAQRIGV